MNQVMRKLGFSPLVFSLLLPLLGLTVAGQEESFEFELIHLHGPNPPAIAVSVSREELPLASSSVLAAETWLKSQVLAHYPSINITTIVIGDDILCNKHYENHWSLVLPTVRNLHYSLTRWGLLNEIKVSAAFSSACFEVSAAQNELKPLLSFLQESSLPYTINPSPHSSVPSLKSVESSEFSRIRDSKMMKQAKPMKIKLSSLDFPSLASAHQDFLERLGFSRLRDIRMIRGEKLVKRKLSSLNFPSFRSRNPSPPAFQFAPVPGSSFSFAPESSPTAVPVSPPDASAESPLTFCLPPAAEGPAPEAGERKKVGLWCVAKPTVPEEKLQEGMDFACGEGGADCDEIMPNGDCFNPDNLVAHASYAFNSYWQKTRQNGGSCSFDGTAILINSDPSFLHCRFELKLRSS